MDQRKIEVDSGFTKDATGGLSSEGCAQTN